MGKEYGGAAVSLLLALLLFGMLAETASATLLFNYTLINGSSSTNNATQGSRIVALNFTIRDDANSTTFYNISFSNTTLGNFTIPPGVNTSSKTNITATNQTNIIGNFTLLGAAAIWNVTNVSGAGAFVNVSFNATNTQAGNVTAANNESFINITNITLPSTDGVYFINLTTNSSVTVSLSLTIDTSPPNVTSNTNNVFVQNGSTVTLSATITDLSGAGLSGVKNATVNVSAINSTLNPAILINQSSGNFWNLTIIADRGDRGLQNLTITAYDNANNRNNSINMTVGITTTTTTTTGGGSSGSTGGGGIVTSEPYTNIEKAERYDKSLIANTPVTYTFKAPEHGIYEIAVTGKESENDIALRVEALKSASKLVTLAPPGTVYKNLNILAGTKRIKEVLIKFKVANSWLTSNNFAGSDVKLVKWDGSQWVQLETSEKTKDASFTYYEAKSDSLSSFAIAGLKGVVVPTATPAGEVTVTPVKPTETAAPAPTPVPTKKVPGFELVLVVAALCSVYLFGRKRR